MFRRANRSLDLRHACRRTDGLVSTCCVFVVKKSFLQLTGIVLVSAALAGLHAWFSPMKYSRVDCDPEQISAEEICLSTVINDWHSDCLWVDARRRQDWQRDGLPGSLFLTTADGESFDALLEEAVPRLASEQKRVVVYCSDQGCGTSKEIAKRLRDYQLVPEVRALHGGWKALADAGMISKKKP